MEGKTDMENLIDIMQLSTEEIDELVKTGCDIMEHPAEYAHKCGLVSYEGERRRRKLVQSV